MKTYAEQVGDLENTRASRVARMEEVAKKSMEEGRSMDESESQEFDDIKGEIKQLDQDIQRYRELSKMSQETAAPIEDKQASVEKKVNNGPMIITKKSDPEDKFEGQSFVRMQIAKAIGKLDDRNPISVAEERWGKSHPNLVNVIKADVAGGGSGAGEWGAELVSQDTWLGDFREYLYAQTVYDKLGLRVVPANVTIKGQDGASSASWVGESKATPVTTVDFNEVTLTPLKVATVAVASMELLRDSSPDAERLIRDSLVESARQKIDSTFFSTDAAVSGVSPAGIFNNISSTASAGTDGDAVANDFKEMMYRFVAANNASGRMVVVMNPTNAIGLNLMRNALDQYEFPTVNRTGGTIYGMEVLTGENIALNTVAIIKPDDIYRIGMDGLQVSMSQDATVEMESAPGADTDTPTAPTGKSVSLWQTNSVGFKVLQSINFQRRRESAVAWIADADYGAAIST